MSRDPILDDVDVAEIKEMNPISNEMQREKIIGGKPYDGREFYGSELNHRSEELEKSNVIENRLKKYGAQTESVTDHKEPEDSYDDY
jgi:hypothetical protein